MTILIKIIYFGADYQGYLDLIRYLFVIKSGLVVKTILFLKNVSGVIKKALKI